MKARIIAVGVVLLVVTTFLSVESFRLYHRDFFYVRQVHGQPGEEDRKRLLKIAGKLDYHDRRHTAMSMMLGEALMNVGEAEKAEEVILAQVRLFPKDPGILRAYADALAVRGKTRKADEVFRRLLEMLREENGGHKKEDRQ